MPNDDERIEFKDLSDSEKAQRMRESASSMKDFGSKKDYYSPKEAIDDLRYADGAGEKAVAGVKLIGKSLFNIGKFGVKELLPGILEQGARNLEKRK